MDVPTSRFAASELTRRSFLVGSAAFAAGVVLSTGSGVLAAQSVEPGASWFQAIDPVRFCDTRPRGSQPAGFGHQRLAPNLIRVPIAGQRGLPGDATAVVITVTGVNPRVQNFLTVYPAGERLPDVSNVNLAPYDYAAANLAQVKLGAGGAIDIFQAAPCDVIVDVAGVYRPTSVPVASGRLVAFTAVDRVLDTRRLGFKPAPGQTVRVDLRGRVPLDAQAIVANLTAVDATGSGFVTVFPRGTQRTETSNLNLNAGQTRAVAVMPKLGTHDGVIGVDIFTERGAHLLLDLAGYITGPGSATGAEGLFVPITPVRQLDTRRRRRRAWYGSTETFAPPTPINSRAQAVAMNLTVTGALGRGGYCTLHAARTPRYETSNLNVETGETVANHAVARVGAAGISCYTFQTAHLIADIFGWYTGAPAAAVTGPARTPPPPGGPLPWIIQIPRLGLTRWVYGGDANRTVDAGSIWHWTGTGLVGENTNIGVFGHRTEHGGPLRYQHALRAGDMLHVYTSDQRRYDYQMTAESITSSRAADILGATRRVGGETISVISCTKLDRTPTSTAYRLISTFRLTGWTDLG